MNEILKNFLPLITGLLMGLAGWLYGKKQSDANVEVTEASALSMIQDSYKELVKDMNDKFATMNKEIECLKVELKKCNESHKLK